MRDAVRQPEPRRQRFAGPHIRFGEIDHGDVTAVLDGQRARGPAEPAADIEHARRRRELRHARQPIRGFLAAAVKMIGRRQVLDRQRVEVLARRSERVEDCALQSRAFPVAGRHVG